MRRNWLKKAYGSIPENPLISDTFDTLIYDDWPEDHWAKRGFHINKHDEPIYGDDPSTDPDYDLDLNEKENALADADNRRIDHEIDIQKAKETANFLTALSLEVENLYREELPTFHHPGVNCHNRFFQKTYDTMRDGARTGGHVLVIPNEASVVIADKLVDRPELQKTLEKVGFFKAGESETINAIRRGREKQREEEQIKRELLKNPGYGIL